MQLYSITYMVLGIGALASLGLALPTGLAFGYGYGYGVRQGYSAFKPPSKTANDLKLSANPATGALGAGLQSAEERTGVKTPFGSLTSEPSIAKNVTDLTSQKSKQAPLHSMEPRERASAEGIHDKEKYWARVRELEAERKRKLALYSRQKSSYKRYR